MLSLLITSVFAAATPPEIPAPCAVLMEKSTGRVLYEKDAHKALPPASVTKVMTLLLVMEALEAGSISTDDMVKVSEYAASMGGSQVFLSPGEEMSLNDLIKATVIASGNDSAVALAEHVAGSEEGFVALMNKRAKELGMNDTCFKNCTGLDAEGHVTSAYDLAVMSRELIGHELIKKYSTVWMDSLRDGAFQLANTNKLIRSYNGITGLKTGSTSVAKYCLAATAMRDNMELVATILAAPTSKERFSSASKLLDFGFANFCSYNGEENLTLPTLPVILGASDSVECELSGPLSAISEKGALGELSVSTSLADKINAPVEKGQKLGTASILRNGEVVSEVSVIAKESVPRLTMGEIFSNLLGVLFMK